MLDAAVMPAKDDPSPRRPPPPPTPPPALLALVGAASRPEVLARAARVLRKGPSSPDRPRVVAALGRALVDGVRRRPPSEWWALGDCAETIGALGSGEETAARSLHEALDAALAARATAQGATEPLAQSIVRALAALGPGAARAVPTITALLVDAVLGPAATAALASIDPSREGAASAATPDTDRRRRVRALPPEDRVELDAARRAARARARVPAGAPPIEIVSAIAAEIRLSTEADEDARADLAFELGVLWGDQVVRAARWEWVELCWDAGAAPAIVSPDRAHACFPTRLVADAIEAARGALPAQVFRRIQARTLPAAAANDLAVIG